MSKVTEQLYIGSVGQASDRDWLKKHHITHIVNCTKELYNFFPDNFSYLKLELEDSINQSLYPVLEKSFNFIRDAVSKGGTVLVHCHAGVSRSSSIVIYYLMKIQFKHGSNSPGKNVWNYRQALTYLKEKHPQAHPNISFSRQLVSVSPEAAEIFRQRAQSDIETFVGDESHQHNRYNLRLRNNGGYVSINSLGDSSKRDLYQG